MTGAEVQGWVQIGLTAVLAALTGVLAYVADKSRKASAQPAVTVAAEAWKGPTHLQIVIHNNGPGIAYDVDLKAPDNLVSDDFSQDAIAKAKWLQQPKLRPGDRVCVLLGKVDTIEPRSFTFTGTCRDIWNEEHPIKSTINLTAMLGTQAQYDENLQSIADSARKIAGTLKTLKV